MEKIIQDIYDELKNLKNGNVADYIPELAKVDPNKFAISICTTNGECFNIGDSDDYFCLQSCSKPLSYCIAHDILGRDTLHEKVGYEPSGKEFNAFILNKDGLPHNPMINAGAIMVSSQIGKGKEPSQRFNILKSYYYKMAGKVSNIGFDNSIFLSEQHHADRNISLAYYMRENNSFKEELSPNIITESLNLYFQQCSTTINCKMGAIISSTLANAGVCPITSEQVVSTDSVKDCLKLMYGCGMYDYSGQFSFEVGLPAKSGVSGCILLVIPNRMGICIWSPPLDEHGNSYKGIEFCKRFSSRLDLNIFHNIIANQKSIEKTLINNFIGLCSEGNLDKIQKLIYKIDINCCDYDKRTPLHLAVSEGNIEIVELLINNGAKLLLDRWGNTPFSEIENKEGEKFKKIKELLQNIKN